MNHSVDTQDRASEQGFTLLELIVTLGLLSLIVAAIMGGLGTGRRVWQMRDDLEQLSALGAARSLLDARLADAMPMMERSPKGLTVAAFQGEPTSLTFAAPLAHGQSGGGLVRQTLYMTQADGHGRRDLVIEDVVFSSGADATSRAEQSQPAVLIENVAQIAFRYGGVDETRAAPVWSASWRRNDGLPRLIGLNVTFPPGDTRRWTELMLSPKIGPAN